MESASIGDPARASLDRARIYRALGRLFREPCRDWLETLRARDLPELRDALARLRASRELEAPAAEVARSLDAARVDHLHRSYQQTFDASGGLRCPPNETAHTAASPHRAVTRTYELADVAGFYRAFGVEVVPGSERPDHIAAELEFMQLLAVKEAVAMEAEEGGEHTAVCRDAARAFLRDHLGRWVPRFVQKLEEEAADPLYASAGRLLDRFVAFDSAQLGVEAGAS